ncbi:MFS transporter [Streptomyces krungchingensis]|uniref:MFS transporter n=1 Tax=Streptomyces krungchingensis TaxID=1565034 RepID=UPI003CF52D17
MRAVVLALHQRHLRLLLSAGLVSLTGDWILRVGLAYYVYALTNNTLTSALMLLASFIPQIVLGSLAGVFVDRWDLRRTMVTANVLLALGLLPLLAVHRPGQIWIVYAVTAWEGCVQQFFTPAQQSLLPRLVGDEHLVTVNALNSLNGDLSRLIGSALGGATAATGGIILLVLLDAASFLVSAALIAALPTARRAERPPSAHAQLMARLGQLRTDWADGMRLSLHQHVLRVVVVFLLVTGVGEGIMSTLFAPFVRTVLHASAGAYGLIVAAQAVGGIGGGLLAASIGNRLSATRALGWAAIMFGLMGFALFLYPLRLAAVWPAVVLMILAGFPGALMVTSVMTLLQRHTTDSHRGRVFGALGTTEGIAIVTGTCAAGFLGQSLGIVPVLAAQGAGYLLAGLLVVILLRHDIAGHAAPESRPHESTVGH